MSLLLSVSITTSQHKRKAPHVANGCNTGTSALPDNACMMPEGECGHIRQWTSVCLVSNILHFRHSKNLPKLLSSVYIYIETDIRCDYGI